MSVEVWTDREVQFELSPRTSDETFDRFFDELPEHYWGWRQRLYGTLAIGSHGLLVRVSGWPRWVPKWWARRSVAKVAERMVANGSARFVIERVVLDMPDLPADDDDD